MRIGGLQKLSLIDFPGRVSCVLFLTGCNFHCPYCHNPELALGQSAAGAPDLELFLAFIAERRALLEGVVLSGGEPTLQEKLPELCAAIHALDLAVKLDTNGSRPEVLRHLLRERLVDFVAMDLKTDPDHYAPLISSHPVAPRIRQSIALLRDSDIAVEFRTTLAPPPLIDVLILSRLAQLVGKSARYALQPCRPSRMLDPAFLDGGPAAYTPSQCDALLASIRPLVGHAFLR